MDVDALSKKERKKTRTVTIFKRLYGFRLHLQLKITQKKETENVMGKKYVRPWKMNAWEDKPNSRAGVGWGEGGKNVLSGACDCECLERWGVYGYGCLNAEF